MIYKRHINVILCINTSDLIIIKMFLQLITGSNTLEDGFKVISNNCKL